MQKISIRQLIAYDNFEIFHRRSDMYIKDYVNEFK